MIKKDFSIKIIWEYEQTPDAAERILTAFDMLFSDTVIEPLSEAVDDNFDKIAPKGNHGHAHERTGKA